jgi:hypothetical protein
MLKDLMNRETQVNQLRKQGDLHQLVVLHCTNEIKQVKDNMILKLY